MGTQPPTPKRAEPHPIFGPRLLWPNGCMDQDATWYGVGLREIVFDMDPATPRKRAYQPHQIFTHVLWPNGWMDEDAAWYGSRPRPHPRPRPHCTRRGPSFLERGTAAPLFSAHVYCGHGRPSQLLLSSCLFTYPSVYLSVLRHTYRPYF